MEPIRYSELIVFRPVKNWKIEILCLKIDNKPEFIKQLISDEDQALYAGLNKLKRVAGIEPRIISMEPVYQFNRDEIIYFFACIVDPYKEIRRLNYYEEAEWYDPRYIYNSLYKSGDKEALTAAIEWVKKSDYSAMYLSRNVMFMG